MAIVLIVAVLVLAVAVLYVTVTLSTRTRQNTAPLIDDAARGVSGQIDATAKELRRQIADELQQDREQQRQDGREVRGRLDRADSRASSMANQILAELDTIRRLVEQLGARQDQFGGDLGKLDLQVARLGESLAQLGPARPQADDAAPEPAAVDGPAIVPGQLYAERLEFAFVLAPPESFSRSERLYRVQIERQVGELPGQLAERYDPSTRARLGEAASDYFAARLGDPVSAAATECWITQNAYPETALVEVCNRISSGLDTIVESPLEKVGTELRLPGPEAATAAGIGAALILQPVTEPLGRVSTFLEITGVVVGMATGLHPLALGAAKMLAHDQFHDFVARRLREAAHQVFEEAPGISALETRQPPTVPSPSTPVRPDRPDDPALEGPGFW